MNIIQMTTAQNRFDINQNVFAKHDKCNFDVFLCRWFAFQKRLCLIIDTSIFFSAMFSQNTSFELDTMINYIKSMWIKAKARK